MFKFDPKFNLERFKAMVEEISKKRVCLTSGAQIYNTFLYGEMFGEMGLEKAGVPNVKRDEERLLLEFNQFHDDLMEDLNEFVAWLDMLVIDKELKNKATNWFLGNFPYLANNPENRLVSETLIADFRYILDTAEGNEKKIIKQIVDLVQLTYELAPYFTYARFNFRNENDWCYPVPGDLTRVIPKGGAAIRPLTCILPRSERAIKMSNYVTHPEMGMLFIGACFDANEGQMIHYFDREGNMIETGLLEVICDILLS